MRTAKARHAPHAGGELSRRAFLGALAAAGIAGAGVLAGCGTQTQATTHTATTTPAPTPLTPVGPITSANAGRLTQLAALQPNDGQIRGIAWSPDGALVAAGGVGDISLWDVASGKQVAMLRGHTDQIYEMAWQPTTGLLASASADGTIRLWRAPEQRLAERVLTYPAFTPVSLAWSPDGKTLASGTFYSDVVLWDTHTGKKLATWPGPPPGRSSQRTSYPFAVYGLAWSPDGQRLVSLRYDTKLLVWDVQTGNLLAMREPDEKPNGVLWAPDNSFIASTSDAGTIQLWDTRTFSTTTLRSASGYGWAYPLTLLQNSDVLATGCEDGSLHIWETQTQTELIRLNKDQAPVWGLAWSPDGQRLASGSDDGTVRLWGVR